MAVILLLLIIVGILKRVMFYTATAVCEPTGRPSAFQR